MNSQHKIFKNFIISENTQKIYMDELNNSKNTKLPICLNLVNKNLIELISLFNYNDFKFYFNINRIFIQKKFQLKNYFFKIDKNKIKIKYNQKIKDQIICSKIKRRDEILKFSYKFIRRKLILMFADKNGYTQLSFSQKKKKFEDVIIKNDSILKSNFFCYEVSKKNLKYLKNHSVIGPQIKSYYKNHYLIDLINETINNDYDFVFTENNSIKDFLEILYCVQLKKNMNILDIFTSYEVLGQYIFEN